MISAEELAEYLELEDPSAAQLDRLEKIEQAAVAFIQTQTRRHFGPPAEHTETLTGRGSRGLWLADRPLQVGEAPLVTLVERAYPGADPHPLAIDTDFGVVLHETEAELVRWGAYSYWGRGYGYTATYRRGYEAGEEPGDIRQAVIDLVGLKRNTARSAGLQGESIGGYSYTKPAVYAFSDGDLKQVPGLYQTIQAWRRPVVA